MKRQQEVFTHPAGAGIGRASRSVLRGRGRSSRGFTLLEILVAMALVALVMVAMNTFIFSMGELWGRNSDVRLFDQHVRNVTRFLESELRTAAFPPAVQPNKPGIAAKEVKGRNGLTEPLLTFELPAGSRLIHWPERPLPDVVCSLAVRDREGLVLLWKSKHEKRFEEDPPRESLITPMVQSLAYDYYDADFKTWRTETALRRENTDEYLTPQRLRLKFAHENLSREVLITLPVSSEGLPIF